MTKTSVLLLAPSLFLAAAAGAGAETVGNVGAANQSVRGTPPGRAARPLSVGVGVENRERIETSAVGSAQIVFRDTSTMTIGRNSAVTIDHFVYDANAGAGRQGVSMAKGVLRFVGGGVSHGSGAALKTPTATIGVRGGTVLIAIGGSCGVLAVLQYGVAPISNAASAVTLWRPGYGVCIPSSNGPIGEPYLVPPETIASILAQLGSARNQTGGVANPPDNADANRLLGDHRPPEDTPLLDALGQFWAGDALVRSQTGVDNQPSPSPSPPPPPQERSVSINGP
jgi:hypothetical protein